ncbi:MAG: hypothetical protein IKY96_08025 [Oscillospiraceae bacterium]|nr:hypothetical protein [Oscillospiraceae bacterium]
MAKQFRIALILILALTVILSCTLIGNRLTDPATYSHTIDVLDENRATVLGLSAASAAASAAVSALPDDICSPLAQEISEFTTWFLLILSVIYLEKYLLTIFGAIACYVLIPIGCSVLLVNCFFPKRTFQSIAAKLLALGAALLLVIPTSVWISDQINEIYSKSIEITVESANAVSDNLIGDISVENQENTTVIDEAKAILGDVSGSVAGVIDQFKNVLNRFVEATAVMIVTTCLIPILVILFFVWIVKTLFNIQIVLPAHMPKPKKPGRSRKEESGPMETE